MKPSEILAEAATVVDESNVPPEFRTVAFEKAVDLIAGRSANGSLGQKTPNGHSEASVTAITPSGFAEKIAGRLKVDVSVVREVYDVDGDIPVPAIPVSKLPSTKRAATQDIALLVTAGRQAAGIEDATLLSDIRAVVDDFGQLDSNYAASINLMDDLLQLRNKGKDRTARLRHTGWERASEVVARLGGVEN